MKDIYETKFSTIGTNPLKYFDNYLKYINNIDLGEKLIVKNLKIEHCNLEVFSVNSKTTLRQNIDAWIWMGFIIKVDNNKLIKIRPSLTSSKLIEIIKWTLIIEEQSDLINKHRNTIIKKLLTLNSNNAQNDKNKKILKECGKFEEIISSDKKFINILDLLWGEK